MFKTDGLDAARLNVMKETAEANYAICPDDLLTIDVFTNKGERIVDPDFELIDDRRQAYNQNRKTMQYLVMPDGFVKLPVVGRIKVGGMTLDDAETALETLYNDFYQDAFIKLEFNNKRAVVLGATGGLVIPLLNENISLLEVLALAGGIDDRGKAYNIRLIRGDLNDPEVHVIDLSTIEGMQRANLDVYPGDIIYVEPVKKILNESLRDITPALSLVTSLATFILLIRSL